MMVEGNDVELERSQWDSHESENENVSEAEGNVGQVKGGEILEPYVGMEFESENDARKFYTDYSQREGFVVRIMQPIRSKIDGVTLTRYLVCNKHGLLSSPKSKMGPQRKTRPGSREGCNAMILFKQGKAGKWVISRFVKEHSHPLDVAFHKYMNPRDKDKKILELTGELQRQEEVFAECRERFVNLVADIEKQIDQHLSPKVLAVVQNVKKAEVEALVISGHR